YIPPEALGRAETKEQQPFTGRTASPADLGLTERQMEVLALMMQGKSNKAISRILDVAEPTVKHHVTAILKALKGAKRTEAVIAVGSLGWELPHIAERHVGRATRQPTYPAPSPSDLSRVGGQPTAV